MTLSGLSDNNRRVLAILRDEHCASRQIIAGRTGLTAQYVSGALNRLEALGLATRPATPGLPGAGWTITADGIALYGQPLAGVADTAFSVIPDVPADGQPAIAREPEDDADEPDDEPDVSAEMASEMSDPDPAEPEPERALDASEDAIRRDHESAEIMRAMEIEVALDQYRARQRFALLPARTARVYREIIAPLPPVLVEELEPLTRLVEAA